MNNHIIFFSGGKSSFAAADFVKSQFPTDNVVLYFNDVCWEDEDLYRFIDEASDKLQLPMLTHSLGLNPIQLMFEKKLVYNSMIGDCSKILKMGVAADFFKKGISPPIEKWRNREYLKNENFTENAILYFGIGFFEMHRKKAIVENWKPFKVEFPLIDHCIDNDGVLRKYGIKQPKLYDLGFTHNNCAGRCVKAGQGHYRNFKYKRPEEFKKIVEQEHYIKLYVSSYRYILEIESDGRDGWNEEVKAMFLQELDDCYRDYFYDRAEKPKVNIHPYITASPKENASMRQYTFMKKDSKPYPLRDFNLDAEKEGQQIDIFDIGGCGCFVDYNS